MKELYRFNIQVEAVEKVPYTKKTKSGEVEAFRNKKTKNEKEIVILKPSMAEIESAEFFFGQKYNEYINAGFLTKSMLASKIGEKSVDIDDEFKDAFLKYIDSAKVIEFYDGAKKLNEQQKVKLENAKKDFVDSQATIHRYETLVRGQYSQTAETKAEEKMIEWFIFNFSYYEDEVDGKKDLFPMFIGSKFDEKRDFYLSLSENKEDIEEENVIALKDIFDKSFETLARVVNIWYNKLADNQKDIDAKLKEIFD